FYALSYVWGDPAAVCDLEINGTAAKIGENLHAALHSIRKNTKFRVIWADALCINQSDNEEKWWQVQQMAAIYSRARATISWLGPPSEDSKLALETLVELGRKTSHFVLQLARDSSRWNAIANICARLYWSRIWIFQEMACA
ncbi:heterokaryon incompatibility, partial [Hyaloscypha bicolor E]